MITVRHASTDDLEPVLAVYVAAWRKGFQHMFSAAVFASENFDAERIAECREAVFTDDCDTFVVENGGRVVGFAVARSEQLDSVIDDIWVHPASWGTGVAGALVARIEDDMRSRGGCALSAWVPEDSPSGRRFFEKLGWRASGDTDQLAIYPQDPNRLLEYVRELVSVDLTRGIPRPTRSLQRGQIRPASLRT